MIGGLDAGTLAAACEGVLTGPSRVIRGVSTDSRTVAAGEAFVAVVGERHDGHAYVDEAVAAGASAVVVSRGVDVPGDTAVVAVRDTQIALGALAASVLASSRDSSGRPDVVAITGSVGKTSTKDLLGHVLAQAGTVIVPVGSDNNEIGLPMTILRGDPSADYLVAEMGARHRGNIAYLCDIARPRVGVVLRVGHAHIAEFGSRQAIVDAKAELVCALPDAAEGGVAVLNADDDLVMSMAARTTAAVVTFGRRADADVTASSVTYDGAMRPRFLLQLGEFAADVVLASTGDHAVDHALAAAAAAHALGVDDAIIAAALCTAVPTGAHRMTLRRGHSGATILDDSYNASPESVAAALRTLAAITTVGARIAVLGPMLELGDQSIRLHEAAGELAAGLGLDRLIVVGAEAAPMAVAASARLPGIAVAVADSAAALDFLAGEIGSEDVVLVKASRAARLDLLAEQLIDSGTAASVGSAREPECR